MSATFEQRLKEIREQRDMTQDELGEAVGANRVAISRYENGTIRPTSKRMAALAEALGVTVEYLMGGERKPHDGYITIPVFGTIPAGIPIEAIEDILDFEELSAAAFSPAHEYFALRIKGNSMYPSYLDGDTVIFRKQNDCENGDDCAVMVNSDDATFKRVKKSEDGIALMPLNPDYDVRFFTNRQIEDIPVRIIGVAVEIRRSLKK